MGNKAMVLYRRVKRTHTIAFGLAAVLACARESAPRHTRSVGSNAPPSAADDPGVTQVGSANVPSDSDAIHKAKAWVDALRARDIQKLKQASAFPFELRELVEYPKCETKRAEKPEDIVSSVDCLLQDGLLIEELATQTEPVTEPISTANLPSWAASMKGLALDGRLVQVRLPGNGVSYQFLLLTTTGGVTRVWKFAEYDPN